MKARERQFLKGVAYAAAELASGWDQPTIAKELLAGAGVCSISDLRSACVDDFDVERLQKVFDEEYVPPGCVCGSGIPALECCV